MARQSPPELTGVSWHGRLSIDTREAMISEAAYYLAQARGFAPGHDLEDWLAAEAALDHDNPLAGEPQAAELQQGGTHGAAMDDGLKRIVKQHPRKAIPQMEDMDPREAPPKE